MFRSIRSLAAERGQGTVEYVALVLLVAGVFAAVVTATKGSDQTKILTRITGQIEKSIGNLGN
jgi:hypothetical protein